MDRFRGDYRHTTTTFSFMSFLELQFRPGAPYIFQTSIFGHCWYEIMRFFLQIGYPDFFSDLTNVIYWFVTDP